MSVVALKHTRHCAVFGIRGLKASNVVAFNRIFIRQARNGEELSIIKPGMALGLRIMSLSNFSF